MIGTVTRANLVLSNSGGRLALGRLNLPSCVTAPDGDGFRLTEGESITIPIEFSPGEEKTTIRGFIVFLHSDRPGFVFRDPESAGLKSRKSPPRNG